MRIGLALAASALLATSAQAVTVINGSFENGVAIDSTGQFFAGGPFPNTTAITGWRVLSTGVDYVSSLGSAGWAAASGTRSVELAGVSSGGIQQRLLNQFVVGETYRLTWRMSVNPFATNGTYDALVSATGGGAQYFSYTKTDLNTPTNMLYQTYTYIWTATSASSNIQFRSRGNAPRGVVIDNVSVSLVPEPADWMLLIAGFGMTGFAMRRRRVSTVAA